MTSHTTIKIRRFINTISGIVSHFLPTPPVTIYCYHGIGSGRFDVELAEFKKQLLYLKSEYTLINLSDIFKSHPKPAAVITFDDAYASLMSITKICADLNIHPTVFALSDPTHANRAELGNSDKFLTTAQLKSLAKSGWTIGCHSATHADFSSLTSKQLATEIPKALAQPAYFAYPKGRYTPGVIAAVKSAGYKLAVSMNAGFVTANSNPYTLPRVGVDRTHTFAEFKVLSSYPTVLMRKLALHTPFAKSII